MAAATLETKNIVVIGGGIIGSCCSYYLASHPSFNASKHTITLLEATRIAGGASGKAGGLLALWAYPSCIVPLSFRLHKELAEKHGGEERWGYRLVNCGHLEAGARPVPDDSSTNGEADAKETESVSLRKRSEASVKQQQQQQQQHSAAVAAGVPEDLDWIVPDTVTTYESMADTGETAQVHPYQFSTSIARLAQDMGVKLVLGSATKVNHDAAGAVESVEYVSNDDGDTHTMPASTVVVAAGAWTPRIVPRVPIEGLRAHSVTIRPTRTISAYALFTGITLPSDFRPGRKTRRRLVTPEIYARPNDEVYACGEGDTLVPLPETTDLVEVDHRSCQDVIDQVGSVSDELRNGEVTARQACYLPNVSVRGGPLVGEMRIKGLYLAAGHTCWGIQNAPGTGKVISEMVWDGKAGSADVGSLAPKRLGL